MRPALGVKILIVFAILLAFWFFYKVVKLLLPMLLVAIVVGYLWDWSTRSSSRNDRFDDYEDMS